MRDGLIAHSSQRPVVPGAVSKKTELPVHCKRKRAQPDGSVRMGRMCDGHLVPFQWDKWDGALRPV